jgi:cell division protein FtsQ
MKRRVKNSVRKAVYLAGYLLLGAGVVVLMGMVSLREQKVPCRAVMVHIPDSLQLGFVTAAEVKEMVMKHQGDFLGESIKKINTRKIEEYLIQYPYILSAQAYKDVRGILHVEVIQRRPVVKIYLANRQVVFLDKEGYLLPFSRRYPVHLLVASGNISLPGGIARYKTVEDLPTDHPLRDIYDMALFIEQDPFWDAQIEQIWVDAGGEYRLTPRVGSHAILLGDANGIEEKFKKLYALYTHALNRLGWNRYSQINLKFKKQIVCTRR